MSSPLPDATPDLPPASLPPTDFSDSSSGGPTTKPVPDGLSYPWLLLVLAGLLAGALAAGLGEGLHGFVRPELKLQELQGNKMMLPTPETNMRATRLNGALANAELGAVLGLALGLAGGLTRRSAQGAAVGGLCGLALGALLGAATSAGVIPLFYVAKKFTESTEPDLTVSLILHASIWASLGAVGGLAYGLGLGDRGRGRVGRAVIGGLIGAFVATLLYEVIGAVSYPLAGTGEPIAEAWAPRVLGRFLVPLLSALVIGKFALTPSRSKP